MSKKAIIWTITKGYVPGMNANLNAMEYYNFDKDIDVYICYLLTKGKTIAEELGTEYIEQWPNVDWIPIDRNFWSEPKTNFWYCVFSDIHYTSTLLRDYDIVLLWGGDLCIVDNFSKMFDISYLTDRIVVGTNEHSLSKLSSLPKEWPYGHTWSVPYADVPWFVPRSKFEIFDLMLNYQKRKDCKLSRMDSMNYALRDMDHEPYAVPGNLWICNVPYWTKIEYDRSNIALYSLRTRMQSFHRKYWIVNYLQKYITKDANAHAINNAKIFNTVYNFFNKQCRVKWTEGVETWDGTLLS